MAKPVIKKLNKLHNPECFVQANTVKGYKYVDLAGEILNDFITKTRPPEFNMGLNGLVIKKPRGKIEELKASADQIWMKFVEIDSLDMVADLFSKEAKKIFETLVVQQISRLGWRSYFIYDFADKAEQTRYFEKLTVMPDFEIKVLRADVKTDKKFRVNLGLKPVVKEEDSKKIHGVLFDVDLSQDGQIDVSEVPKLLKEYRSYLAAEDGFLKIVNDTFISE